MYDRLQLAALPIVLSSSVSHKPTGGYSQGWGWVPSLAPVLEPQLAQVGSTRLYQAKTRNKKWRGGVEAERHGPREQTRPLDRSVPSTPVGSAKGLPMQLGDAPTEA